MWASCNEIVISSPRHRTATLNIKPKLAFYWKITILVLLAFFAEIWALNSNMFLCFAISFAGMFSAIVTPVSAFCKEKKITWGLSAWSEGNKSHNHELKANKRLIFTLARIPQGMQKYIDEKCLYCSSFFCFWTLHAGTGGIHRFLGCLIVSFSKSHFKLVVRSER